MLVDHDMDAPEKVIREDVDQAIYEELGELTKYVEMTTRTIREMEAPVSVTADQLPQATGHLGELVKMTEEGTHRVMTLTEELQESQSHTRRLLLELQSSLKQENCEMACEDCLDRIRTILDEDNARLLNIDVALSFQDLVAQRVKKLTTILEEVENKLLKLVVVFGIQQKSAKPQQEGRGYDMLQQLEKSQTTALKQDLVDDILGEFGFH